MNLRDFENWAIGQGSVGNPTAEESYKGECVSLVQQYLSKVHDIPFKARGNAKDWANINIEGFTKIGVNNSIKAGDILVYNYGTYGHMAIVDAENKSLEQNRNGNKKVTVGDIRKEYVAIQRPNKVDLGNIEAKYSIGKVYTTQVVLKVRTGAGTNNAVVAYEKLTQNGKENAYNNGINKGCLKNGTRVTVLETKKVGNDVWLRIPSGWIAGYYDSKTYVK